jgi:arylformamidase
MSILDISVPLNENTPTWPGSPGVRVRRYKRLEDGNDCNNSCLECDLHAGTHVDAPSHFLRHGPTVDKLSLGVLIGPAFVVDMGDIKRITAQDLDQCVRFSGVKRLLLKTSNSEIWRKGVREFKKDFVALAADAARWVVDRGDIALIGVDYLSVQCYADGPETHRILLEGGLIIVEGLNLAGVSPGAYEFICLPIALSGVEGAPARAVLRTPEACRTDCRNSMGDGERQ